QHWNVGTAWNEQAHVDAILRRRAKCLHVCRHSGIVRIGQPECLARRSRDQLVETQQPGPPWLARDDAHRRITRYRDAIASGELLGRNRRADYRPHAAEGALDFGDRRTAHFHAGITPRRNAALWIAHPRIADAETGDESDPAIDDDALPVIAVDPAERTCESEWIETANFDASRAQRFPESRRSLGKRTHPVVQQAHGYARTRLFDERISEAPARYVVAHDVRFEIHVPLCRCYRIEPRRIILGCIAQKPDAVAIDPTRTRC